MPSGKLRTDRRPPRRYTRAMGLEELNAGLRAIAGLQPADAAEAAYAWARTLLPVAAEYRTAVDCGALWLTALAIYAVSVQDADSRDAAALYRCVETVPQGVRADFPPQLRGFMNALLQMPSSVLDVAVLTARQALIAIGAAAT